MNHIEKKAYSKIIILVSLVLALFYVECLYLPEKVKTISMEIKNKRQELNDLDMQTKRMDDVRKEYEKIKENSKNINKSIVNYSDIYDFTSSIKEVADKSGVEYENTVSNKGDNSITADLLYLDFSMNVTGNFDQMMTFLNYLESLKYYNNIEEISVTSKSDIGKLESDNVAVNFVLRTYAWDDRKK